MEEQKQKRLEAKGWRVGTAAEFLGLTPEEEMLIEIRLALSKSLRQRREGQMTQLQLAEKLNSSQSRIARAENGHSSVPIDLLIRAMLATGATADDIATAIASAAAHSTP